ncbi:MAG: hypothetical protein BroJett015_41740 [Chloroflexota bacterium]|nr:hypothetical protein [Chloroflexota bacterium]GIK58511.1 MAG: hypothetical protein BroJett015_41740 [Chloroflexota bacterium]
MSHSLQICCVHHNDKLKPVGLLYFENERVVILLNNLIEKAGLGPIKFVRNEHIEPESSIIIIPRNQVTAIEILQEIE